VTTAGLPRLLPEVDKRYRIKYLRPRPPTDIGRKRTSELCNNKSVTPAGEIIHTPNMRPGISQAVRMPRRYFTK
jgi:hypothetical protein